MPDYNFLNLSSAEFENLCRDLLQKKLNTYIESFTQGPDGGIDLRYAKDQNETCIIQCKRYKSFASLKNTLKEEVKKVKKLKPERYILTTSAGLTPDNKCEVKNILSPFIQSIQDIYGRDDLNNLLGKYTDIENQYYKLWLSSTNILDKILHSKIYNQSQFEIEEIKENIKFYVQNISFNESLEILQKEKFVIISGIPGIGKTTLARILTYHLLANGFEEFVFLNDSIAEGYELFKEGKKQVFLFDDFLGSNFLKTSKTTNEEKNIIRFIDKIRRSKNKLLIFTTREYILNQAKLEYESFNQDIPETSKCVVDLSKYTKKVRAEILYNHLYFNDLPEEYLKELLKDKFYLQLINHRNYSPRIIESIVKSSFWQKIEPSKFPKELKNTFDNPFGVWQFAYTKHITELSQYILMLMLSAGSPILYDDLLLITQEFAKKLSYKYSITASEKSFKEALKELENTFITIQKDEKSVLGISFQNPSIQDFLINYLRDNKDLIKDIIENATFINQLYHIFTFFSEEKFRYKILLSKKITDVYVQKICQDFDKIWEFNTKIEQITSRLNNGITWIKSGSTGLKELYYTINSLDINDETSLKDFTKERFLRFIDSEGFEEPEYDVPAFYELLKLFKADVEIDILYILNIILKNCYYYYDLEAFDSISEIYPDEYEKVIENNNTYLDVLNKVKQNELEDVYTNLEEGIHKLEMLEASFGVDTSLEIDEIKEQMEEKAQLQQDEYKEYYFRNSRNNYSENTEIENMFETLTNKD